MVGDVSMRSVGLVMMSALVVSMFVLISVLMRVLLMLVLMRREGGGLRIHAARHDARKLGKQKEPDEYGHHLSHCAEELHSAPSALLTPLMWAI